MSMTFGALPNGAVFILNGHRLVKIDRESARTTTGRVFYITKKAEVYTPMPVPSTPDAGPDKDQEKEHQ